MDRKYKGDEKVYHVPKPPVKWSFEWILNKIGLLIGLILAASVIFALSSCTITERQAERDYELEKLYLQYSFKRDSIIIEYNK